MTLMGRGDGGAMEEQNEWIPQTYFEDRVKNLQKLISSEKKTLFSVGTTMRRA